MARLAERWGVKLATQSVCRGHHAPADFLAEQVLDRPSITLWIGSRGSGKSFLSALGTWMDSLQYDHHGTRILGGSLAQSEQIYTALRTFDRTNANRSPLTSFTKRHATFQTGSEVAILAASPTSVRGPHVATLRLDEVDEIDEDIRESSMGMCMAMNDVPASVVMTSTWHRVGGPMSNLIEKGRAGAFPVRTFCVFEVLERCPDERSGLFLEKCPECPLVTYCHGDRDLDPAGLPKAKRSSGHYSIDSLIQKIRTLSQRVFRSDYLCEGPRADGIWFTQFSDQNISVDADYDPSLPVHVSVDSGVFTGAIYFQVRDSKTGPKVSVFGDYLTEGTTAEADAIAILADLNQRCPNARRMVSTDSAGGARNPVGPTVLAEYQRAGLVGERGIVCWPKYPGCVADGLQLVEALIRSADDSVNLTLHPRCTRTITALQSYTRAKRGGQWQDYPEDPQHPHEELVDALRGGLHVALPESRRPLPAMRRVRAGGIF
jgi:hypothetical protein